MQRRFERLEKARTLRGDILRMGYVNRPMIRASTLIAFDSHSGAEILSKLRSLPNVRRARTTWENIERLVKITAQTTADLDRILDEIGSAKVVKNSESLIYLTTKLDGGATLSRNVNHIKKSPQGPVGIMVF